jgi:cell shape-determining protein MreC
MIRHRKKLKNKKMEDLELEIQKLRDENKDFSNRLINLR